MPPRASARSRRGVEREPDLGEEIEDASEIENAGDARDREQRAEQIAQRILQSTGVERESHESIDDYLEKAARQARDTARYR